MTLTCLKWLLREAGTLIQLIMKAGLHYMQLLPVDTYILSSMSFIYLFIWFISIYRYLLECGSFPASINNDGQTPSDLAEDYDEIVEVLQSEINRLGT